MYGVRGRGGGMGESGKCEGIIATINLKGILCVRVSHFAIPDNRITARLLADIKRSKILYLDELEV